MRIMGVDFSGAQPEVGKTWIAEGRLEGNILTIESCRPISRMALTNELAGLTEPAVAAMDFPFSVPEVFVNFWHCHRPNLVPYKGNMTNLWAAAAATVWPDFRKLRDAFCKPSGVNVRPLPMRKYDPKGSYSPLKWDGNPNMVPMTFRGMRMLNSLYPGPADKPVWIPPLQSPALKPHTTLLEVMPGLVLRRFGLHYRGYKGNTQSAMDRRREILCGLTNKIDPLVVELPDLVDNGFHHHVCLHHDDAVDAVVAAIAAALWEVKRNAFRHPESKEERQVAFLEGWLYAPKEVRQKK